MEMDSKKELRSKLCIALDVLKQIEAQEDICFTLENKMSTASKELLSPKLSTWGVLAIISLIIGIVPSVLILVAFMLLLMVLGSIDGYIGFVVLGVSSILAFFSSIIMLFFSFMHFLQKKKKNEIIKKDIKCYRYELQKETHMLNQIISANFEKIVVVPDKYRHVHAISHFLEYIDTMRVDNIRDAINLYEEELHRLRMELGQQEILTLQQQQHRLLECIDNYSRASVVISAANTMANISAASSHRT